MWYELAFFVSGTIGGVGLSMLFNWLRFRRWESWDRSCGYDYDLPPMDYPSGIDRASNPFWQNRHVSGESIHDRSKIPISPELRSELDATLRELSEGTMRNNKLARKIADGGLKYPQQAAPTVAFDSISGDLVFRCLDCGEPCGPALYCDMHMKRGAQ